MSSQPAQPPQPPELPKRFRLHPHQMWGLPLIMLLPILAISGALEDHTRIASHRTASLEWTVEYPSQFKFKQSHYLKLKARNISDSKLDTVIVGLDSAYLAKFTQITILPEPENGHSVIFTDLAAGEKREVLVDIEAKHYGTQRGTFSVETKGERTSTPISTYILW